MKWKPCLPLSSGDRVVIDQVESVIIASTPESVTFRSVDGADEVIGPDKLYALHLAGRLEYEDEILAELDKGSDDDRALAEHARRPLHSLKPQYQEDALRKHFQSCRMAELFSDGLPRTKDGYEKAAEIINAEERELYRDGVTWARVDADSHGGGLVPVDRKWQRTYSISALAPRHYDKGRGVNGVDREYWEMCVCWIIYIFHLLAGKSFRHVYEEYITPAYLEVARYVNFTRLLILDERSYQRLMFQTWTPRKIAELRNDKKKVRKQTVITKISEVCWPFQRIEIDSTDMDLRVYYRDGRKRRYIRPFITIAIDVCTRLIIGLWISWDHQSSEATRQVLRQSLWPKDDRIRRGAINAWPSGIAKPVLRKYAGTTIVWDRGSENDNRAIELGLGKLGISSKMCAPRSPESKPHVERLLGHFAKPLAAEAHAEKLEANWKRKVFKSETEAREQLPSIILDVTHWAVDDYNVRYHDGIKAAPLDRFSKLSDGRIKLPNMADKIYLGRQAKARISREGATVFGELYTCDELQAIFDREINRRTRSVVSEAFVDPDFPDRAAILDNDPLKPSWVIALSRDPGRTRDRPLDEILADRHVSRKSRRKKSQSDIETALAAKSRRDARRPEILGEISEDLATHKSTLARYTDKSASRSSSNSTPASQPVQAVEPSMAAQSPPTQVPNHAEPEGGLLELFEKDGE